MKALSRGAYQLLAVLVSFLILLPFIAHAQVLPPSRGGTGTSTAPSYGKVLVGNANGTYTLTATSSLGITGGGGGSSAWGGITGTLSDQTDLVAALAAKFGLSDWYATTTTALNEGSNLYFTDARARSALSETITGLGFDSGTGVFSLTSGYTIPLVASTTEWATAFGWGNHATAGYLSSTAGNWSGTFDSLEGTAYLARANHTGTQLANTISDFASAARALLSSTATGLTYTSGTGALSLTSGYVIPLSASTTEWASAYANRITSATYPLQIASNAISLAFGTSTSNTWGGTQTFTNSPVVSALTGGLVSSNASTDALFNTATSAVTCSTGVSCTGFVSAGAGGSTITASLGTSVDLASEVTGTLPVANGGTGSTTLSGILKGNGTGGVQTAVSGTDYQPAGNYVTALTGDVAASGPGSAAATLATVNANVGSFTNANITVNAKGLITAASNGASGSGGAIGTSTALADGQVTINTGVNTVGGDGDFLWSQSLNRLTAPYASTTGLSIGSDFVTDLDGVGLTLTGGVLNVDASQNIATLSNLTGNGAILTSGGIGTLGTYAGTSCTNQFVRSLSGAIAATCATVANTDLANSTISGIALGSNLADLTATNGTLTFSGTYNGSAARTIGLNLGNANTWTALQTFANSTTSIASFGYASSTVAHFGSAFLPNLATPAGAFLAISPSGQVIATSTPAGGGSGTVGAGTTGQFPYYAANGTALTATSTLFLASTGRVAIGTTTPEKAFVVEGNQSGSIVRFDRKTAAVADSDFGVLDLTFTNTSTGQDNFGPSLAFNYRNQAGSISPSWPIAKITARRNGADDAGKLILQAESTPNLQTLTIDGVGGVVAVGSTSPSSVASSCGANGFCVVNQPAVPTDAEAQIKLVAGEGADEVRSFFTARSNISPHRGEVGTETNHDFSLFTNNTRQLTISTAGLVGIGTSTPYARLSVVGETVARNFTATSTSATSTLQGTVLAGSGGMVGVGTTTPTKKFSVTGESWVSATSTSAGLNVLAPTTGTSTQYIYSKTAGFGGRIILEDSDAAGCTEVYALNGVLTAASIACPTEI